MTCGRNESLSCESVKKNGLPEKMIRQNRRLGRTLDGKLALLRIVNVRQVQVQLSCRTRKRMRGFHLLNRYGNHLLPSTKGYPNGINSGLYPCPLLSLRLYARREIFNRGVDSYGKLTFQTWREPVVFPKVGFCFQVRWWHQFS